MANPVSLSGKSVPVLDRARPVGDVYGSDDGSRFYQDGHYFKGTGEYLLTDEDAANRVAKARQNAATQASVQQEVLVQMQEQSERIVTEDELPDLMALQEAKTMLSQFSMPQIIAMTEKAGGPVQSGENAQQLMVGWLIKFTI
jgi:hypothetical protein